MTYRITSRMMTDNAVNRLHQRLGAFEKTQNSLATGRRMRAASDDVPGMNRALDIRAALAANAQAQRNADDGMTWVNLADGRLGSLGDEVQRVRELAIRGINGTANASERDAMAQEVAEIRDSFTALANSRHQGRPLFSGFSGQDAVAKVAGVWAYQGDTGSITRRVSDADVVAVNVTGDQVFGFAAGEDVFTLLDGVEAHLRTADTASLQTDLSALDRGLDRLLQARSALGAAGARIEAAQFRAQTDEVSLRTELSEVEDVDMADAIMELQLQEVGYQAAQGALAKTLQPSLATFLR